MTIHIHKHNTTILKMFPDIDTWNTYIRYDDDKVFSRFVYLSDSERNYVIHINVQLAYIQPISTWNHLHNTQHTLMTTAFIDKSSKPLPPMTFFFKIRPVIHLHNYLLTWFYVDIS